MVFLSHDQNLNADGTEKTENAETGRACDNSGHGPVKKGFRK